jgi:hypothetical protein
MQDTPIDELELSVRSFSALLEMGNLTLGDLVINTKELLRERLGAEGEVEVRALLASHGLRLADDVGVDVGPEEPTPPTSSAPWGALFVWREGGVLDEVVASMDAAYARAGLARAEDGEAPAAGSPWLRQERELVADAVWVEEQEAPGWFAVTCARQEWCVPGAHPLALALSRAGDEVVSVTSAPGAYTEVTVYGAGAPVAWRLTGRKAPGADGEWEDDPKALIREGVAGLEAGWFVARGALGAPEEVWTAARLGDLDAFGALTGCEAKGSAGGRPEGEGVVTRVYG